ncbi:hypothetical protein N7533_012881 [Penicillium manginii]|uniref:uncharacterized protein n=1 Tax=Penicillium manginii TaxID=203109 RepID=UPI0025467BFF|nr:uncharacterized protein N7533_012881 [Penicillium manginii]KAJ5740097.1 hypothetical protein N7533_012881 [Penicillium manginii]
MSSDALAPTSSPPRDPAEINKLVTEQDDQSFYHHPSWPERWSHPEPNEVQQTFCTRRSALNPPWGYIIYRTVYTAESDELWPLAMDKLAKIMDDEIDSDFQAEIRRRGLEDEEPDGDAERLVRETHKDVIFSDKQFWDGATIEQVRDHFAEYLRASKDRGTGRFEGCLFIDERSLKSIVASPDPQPWLKGKMPEEPIKPWGFVGMIDGRYPGNRWKARYTGYMRVDILSLWHLYNELKRRNMQELCPSEIVPEGLIPFYDSGMGKAQDEEGNFIPTVTDRTTRIF